MSATPTEPAATAEPKASKLPTFGANQVIAMIFTAVVLGMVFGLTLRVDDTMAALDKFQSWSLAFLPIVLGIVLGLSAGLKGIQAFTDRPPGQQ